ncbi:TetR/AcrR family transcriptional regulator [Demequina sp.]|uniref:TetR/AcrR family transcriptional regulator n=1 Tax=Demequina sp. TaxID=2050685 RepID=UPI003D11094F
MNASPDRMSAEDRREQIILAAAAVFGERGYAGGTTDAIAKQAGISQAYVVRMFGTKEKLFSAVGQMANDRIVGAFRAAIATFPPGASDQQKQQAMGDAYASLMQDRGLLLSLLQLFSQGHDPVLGVQARQCFLDVFRVVRDEAGLGPQVAVEFFARGMLMMILMAMRMQDATSDLDAAQFLSVVLGPLEAQVVPLLAQPPLGDARR